MAAYAYVEDQDVENFGFSAKPGCCCAHHRSLPSADDEDDALEERERRPLSIDIGLETRSLLSLAILRETRWVVGLMDSFESSLLGGSSKMMC